MLAKKYIPVWLLLLFCSLFFLSSCAKGALVIHHVFPQQYRSYFDRIGINIDDFGIPLTQDDHFGKGGRGVHTTWNPEWKDFISKNPSPSKAQVMGQLEQMLSNAGFKGKIAFVSYRGVNRGLKTGTSILVKHNVGLFRMLGKIGDLMFKLLGGFTFGKAIMSFFAGLGSTILGYFSMKTTHSTAAAIGGLVVMILGLLDLAATMYFVYLNWIDWWFFIKFFILGAFLVFSFDKIRGK